MLPTTYQEFINKRTYSRFIDALGRREEWWESVGRYAKFFEPRIPNKAAFKSVFYDAIGQVMTLGIMPSMRALWTAGPALEKENLCGFNCGYVEIDEPRRFAELLYALMCGTGVGFSVERQVIARLPEVPAVLDPKPGVTVAFEDSKEGWAAGLLAYLNLLWKGVIPSFDLSRIRPAGERLKTFGGRASGPEPLERLLHFATQIFLGAKGRKLNSLEVYDMCCYIASVVVVGGVRRSATISLSNPSDERMANAKMGNFYEITPWRALANNSAAYTEKPDAIRFMREWLNLAQSGTGERGIFNREGAKQVIRNSGRRDPDHEFGCNPCSEIILRSAQLCNLTEVVVRPKDQLSDLTRKVELATALGCLQATLTDYKFVGDDWRANSEDERLLGVSLTGLRDHMTLGKKNGEAISWLREMKRAAIETAQIWSSALGISMPAAITCVKPSGTVSQLVDCASGLHVRHAPYYLRRVQVSVLDPIAQFMMNSGVPWHPVGRESMETCKTVVFEFPMRAPHAAKTRNNVTAIEQLEYWKMLQEYWCEHKPSCTINVKEDEWPEVGSWVYQNWEHVSGIAFFPHHGGIHPDNPYEEITREMYERRVKEFPQVDFTQLAGYEVGDQTQGAQEYACAGGACDI